MASTSTADPRLEPFLLLARSAKGAAASKIILDAIAAPGVYTFSELLAVSNIGDLKSSADYASSHALLEIYAFGTLQTYFTRQSELPQLSPQQLTKLRHLTLVSLALKRRTLAYDALLDSLQIGSIRELEDLITDAIYAGLIVGKMHHHEKTLHIDWATGRDIAVADLERLKTGLETWCSNAEHLLAALDEKIHQTRVSAHHDRVALAEYNTYRDAEYVAACKDRNDRGGKSKGHVLGGGDFGMPDHHAPGKGDFLGRLGDAFGGSGRARGNKRRRD